MKLNTNLSTARALRETFLNKMAMVVAHAAPAMTDEEARLGQLLLSTGNLSRKALDASLELARTVRLPLGVVLLMNGLVSPETIDRAINLQSMIHRGLPPSIARIILRYASIADVTTEEALQDFSMDNERGALDCWLAQVVTACGLLTFEQIDDIRTRARGADMSWARYATENGILTINVLSAAMHAVVLMDINQLSYNDAVALVKAVAAKPTAMPILLRVHIPKHSFDASTINLAALLYASDVLSERNALDLLSLAYRNRVNMFDLIDQHDLLSDAQFDLALSVSTMLNKGLPMRTAIAKLKANEVRCPEREVISKWQMAVA
jgi:hypothetical protein